MTDKTSFNVTDKFLYSEFCNKIENFDSSPYLKNKVKSNEFRQTGNKYFGKNNFDDALIYFVKAIKYAPNPSEELGLAYGNKSAVLYHLKNFKESINCIDLAIKYEYPKEKLKKLEERKSNCLNKLKEESVEKSIEDNKKDGNKQGFVENCVEIDWLSSDLAELGVRSKRNLNKSEIILIEKPFVHSLHKDNYNDYCYSCFKKLSFQSQYPCRKCIQINYCSLKCERMTWINHHSVECGFIDLYQINDLLEHHTKICSKLICNLFIESKMNKDELLKRIKQTTKKSGRKLENNYESFAQLIEHHNQDKNNYSLISLLLLAFFNVRFKSASKTMFKDYFKEDELILIKSTIEKHIRQIQVNALMVTETDVKKKSQINVKDTQLEKLPVFESTNIGIGIFINLSLINHSCNPNLSISGFNNRSMVVIKANRKINKNEWLCFSYGAHYMFQSLNKRKKLLWETYFFECNCEACIKGLEPYSNMLICSNCKTEIYSSKQEYCNLCSTKIIREEINNLKLEVNKKIDKIEKILKDKDLDKEQINRFIIDLIQYEKKLQSFLHSNNKCLEKIYFVQFACYRRLHNYQKLYESALAYWQCLLTKTDYFDLMSFNNLIIFSNYLIKSIEEMINFDYSSKPIAVLIQLKINDLITKLKKTIEQVFDIELEKKDRVLNLLNNCELNLENYLGSDPTQQKI